MGKTSGTVRMYDKEYVSMRRAKEISGYGSSNIYRLVESGDIERVKRGSTHVYNLADIERYIYGGTNERAEATKDSEI
jgi:hypothetical protein